MDLLLSYHDAGDLPLCPAAGGPADVPAHEEKPKSEQEKTAGKAFLEPNKLLLLLPQMHLPTSQWPRKSEDARARQLWGLWLVRSEGGSKL